MTVEAEIPVPRKLRSNSASLGKADYLSGYVLAWNPFSSLLDLLTE